jgi:hypothetical protein
MAEIPPVQYTVTLMPLSEWGFKVDAPCNADTNENSKLGVDIVTAKSWLWRERRDILSLQEIDLPKGHIFRQSIQQSIH